MLIHKVIQSGSERNEKMIQQYERLAADLPHGSLICRKGEYYYLKYRENGKLRDEYIGKDPNLISDIRDKLEERKHYTQMLSARKQEQKAIQTVWEGLR